MGPDAGLLTRYGAEIVFYALILFYVMYGIFLSYHWFTFGRTRKAAMQALLIYLVCGAILFTTMSVALSNW